MSAVTRPVPAAAKAGLSWTRRHPVAAFLLVCFGLTWVGWGPGLAAFGVALASGSARALFARITLWRIRLRWYAVALLGPGVLSASALALNGLPNGVPPNLPDPGAVVVLVALGWSLLANWEEIGWRGFLLPRLLQRCSALEASLLVGLVWTAWHVAFGMFVSPQLLSTPVPALTVFGLASSVVLTWLYQASGKSALPALLFHAANDAWSMLLPSPADARLFELYAGTYALVAIALVVSDRVPMGATEPGRGGE